MGGYWLINMINTVTNIIKEFTKATKENKVYIVLIAFICILLFERKTNVEAQSQLRHEIRVNDSISDIRFNRVDIYYKEIIKDCQEQQQKQMEQFLKVYVPKFEGLFQTTDELYHESKIKEQ